LFRRLGLDEDLAYGAFAGQIEELKADGGGMFLSWGVGSSIVSKDRLALSWAMAGALAAIGQAQGADWFAQLQDERVAVPDDLLDQYRQNPRQLESHVPAEWRAPSPPLRMVLAELLLDHPYYPYVPVGDPEAPPDEMMVREAVERDGYKLSAAMIAFVTEVIGAALAGRASIAAEDEPCELVCWVRVPKPNADRLAAELGLDCHDLTDWLEESYGRICASRTSHELAELISPTGQPAENGLAAYLERHPNFPHAYVERAIELDLAGSPVEAWDMMATALAMDPSDPIFWQSAGVLLRRLGEDAQAAVAAAVGMSLEAENDRRPG
jgi:hypothetical protein